MDGPTCAACDSELDADAIAVTLGGQRLEACCEACARALGEAHAAALGDGA